MTNSISRRDLFAAAAFMVLFPEFMSSDAPMTNESFVELLTTTWNTADSLIKADTSFPAPSND